MVAVIRQGQEPQGSILQDQVHFGVNQLLMVGERPDYAFNSIELDDYAVVILNLSRRFGKHISLQGRIENALDEDYQIADNFKAQSRAVYLNLRFDNE